MLKLWISKKMWRNLEKRIAGIEKQVQSQQEEIRIQKYPYKALKKAFAADVHQK